MEPYLEVLVFALVSLAVPGAMLAFSWLVRPKPGTNEVQAESYESAEQTVGGHVSVMEEYMPYFSVFLMFEVVIIAVLLWAATARSVLPLPGFFVAVLPIAALFASWIALGMAHRR